MRIRIKVDLLLGELPCQGKLFYEPFSGSGGFYKVLDCARLDVVKF